MTPRSVNIILTALCLGLLGTIGFMAYLMKTSPEPAPYALNARLVTNTVTQIAVRKVYPTNFLASLGKLPVNWRMIESTNYQVYIANLREGAEIFNHGWTPINTDSGQGMSPGVRKRSEARPKKMLTWDSFR